MPKKFNPGQNLGTYLHPTKSPPGRGGHGGRTPDAIAEKFLQSPAGQKADIARVENRSRRMAQTGGFYGGANKKK